MGSIRGIIMQLAKSGSILDLFRRLSCTTYNRISMAYETKRRVRVYFKDFCSDQLKEFNEMRKTFGAAYLRETF